MLNALCKAATICSFDAAIGTPPLGSLAQGQLRLLGLGAKRDVGAAGQLGDWSGEGGQVEGGLLLVQVGDGLEGADHGQAGGGGVADLAAVAGLGEVPQLLVLVEHFQERLPRGRVGDLRAAAAGQRLGSVVAHLPAGRAFRARRRGERGRPPAAGGGGREGEQAADQQPAHRQSLSPRSTGVPWPSSRANLSSVASINRFSSAGPSQKVRAWAVSARRNGSSAAA